MNVEWVDNKRYAWPLGALLMLLPMASGTIAMTYGLPFFWWFTPFIIFVVIPVLDWLNGEDTSNPPEEAVPALTKDPVYRWMVMAAVPTLYLSFFWCVRVLAHGGLAWHETLGLVASLGVISGISVNTAHELGHKAPKLERLLAKIALAPSMYGNFFVEHVRGHHVRVATPEDPASSRFGEHLWEFIPRSMAGAHVSAWELEKKRLASQKFAVPGDDGTL